MALGRWTNSGQPHTHHHKLDYKKGGRYQINRGQEVDYRSKVASRMLDEYGHNIVFMYKILKELVKILYIFKKL